MIISCHVCNADPAGRWKQPAAMIFHDRYEEDGSVRRDSKGRETFVRACRDHVSAKREAELLAREIDRGGELR